jgi:hypothetical protein
MRYDSERLGSVLDRPEKADSRTFDHRVDLATRTIYAPLQQRMMFYPLSVGRYSIESDDEFARQLTMIVLLCVGVTCLR